MDVAAIAVGTDFVDQVERAISTSDVSLVLIGPDWLGATDSEGRRRLDDPDDHVRSEVRSALASPHPVVPVLVGEASLPPVDQLPDDLVSLVRRQAIELRDESWPEDVEMLLRRLEGKETVKARRRWIPVAIGLVALGVASALIWQAQADGDNDDLTQCPAPDETWTVVDVAPNATDVEHLDRDRALRYTVESTDFRKESRDWLVVLHVRLDNESEDVPGNDDYTGYGPSVFDALHVNQISVGTPYCFGENSGDSNLAPGEAAVARVGFLSSFDPTGAALMLETDGPLFIEITPGT
jgi:TIR domain